MEPWARTMRKTMRRHILKPMSKKMSQVNCRQLCRLVLYAATLATLVLTVVWTSQKSQGEVVTLTLTSNNEMIKAVYKCAYENPDGTVDLVFNIPRDGQELLRLNHLPTSGPRLLLVSSSNDTTTLQVTNREVKSKYPLSLDSAYVINTLNICPVGQTVDYLVIVHSATAYFERRRAIRETYGGKGLFGSVVQRVVFLLGTTSDPATTKGIQEEALIHKDIVQGRFVDSYHNLTHKGVLGFRWISDHCPQAKLVIKIDDDVFINPFRFVQHFLPVYKRLTRTIGCHLRPGGTSPIVRGKGKWQVQEDEFKGHEHYPFDYCNGYFVLITSDLIRPMLNAARLNPFFWIDDVYIFGILPATVGSTKFLDIRANLSLKYDEGNQCFEEKAASCQYVAVSQWKPNNPDRIWYTVLSNLSNTVRREFQVFGLS